MAQMVTIEGSMTPSSDLPRGQRRDVVLTDRIERLVTKGFVVIVGEPWDSDAPAPQIAPATGEPRVGVEHPADGTWSPEISSDGSGQALPPAPIDAGPDPSLIQPVSAEPPVVTHDSDTDTPDTDEQPHG